MNPDGAAMVAGLTDLIAAFLDAVEDGAATGGEVSTDRILPLVQCELANFTPMIAAPMLADLVVRHAALSGQPIADIVAHLRRGAASGLNGVEDGLRDEELWP